MGYNTFEDVVFIFATSKIGTTNTCHFDNDVEMAKSQKWLYEQGENPVHVKNRSGDHILSWTQT